MARKRLIAPEFFTHEELYQLEASTGLPARLAFAGLWCQADREGRFRWRPMELKLGILPWDPCDFGATLDALASKGFIHRYEVDGRSYGLIPHFSKHQTFHSREAESKLPAPCSVSSTGQGTEVSGSSRTVAVAVTGTEPVTEPVTSTGAVAPPDCPDWALLGLTTWRGEIGFIDAKEFTRKLDPLHREEGKSGEYFRVGIKLYAKYKGDVKWYESWRNEKYVPFAPQDFGVDHYVRNHGIFDGTRGDGDYTGLASWVDPKTGGLREGF